MCSCPYAKPDISVYILVLIKNDFFVPGGFKFRSATFELFLLCLVLYTSLGNGTLGFVYFKSLVNELGLAAAAYIAVSFHRNPYVNVLGMLDIGNLIV